MALFKKATAEFIGTAVLVLIGCGTAMTVGCNVAGGYLTVALAFGLGLLTAAYSVGNISGCHINPAVSFAMLICGKMKLSEFFAYIAAQFLGGTLGAGLLAWIFDLAGKTDLTGAYGTNSLAGVGGNPAAGLLVEMLLTFVFVFAILGVTAKKENASVGGVVIALSLVAVHLLGIGLTGTSVNPARSFGPALFALADGNSAPMSELWVFIIAPFAGAALAALLYLFITGHFDKMQEIDE